MTGGVLSDFQLLENYQNHYQRQRHLQRRNKVLIGEALFACGAAGMGGLGEVGRGGGAGIRGIRVSSAWLQ